MKNSRLNTVILRQDDYLCLFFCNISCSRSRQTEYKTLRKYDEVTSELQEEKDSKSQLQETLNLAVSIFSDTNLLMESVSWYFELFRT